MSWNLCVMYYDYKIGNCMMIVQALFMILYENNRMCLVFYFFFHVQKETSTERNYQC